jgi:hypothetical protein
MRYSALLLFIVRAQAQQQSPWYPDLGIINNDTNITTCYTSKRYMKYKSMYMN